LSVYADKKFQLLGKLKHKLVVNHRIPHAGICPVMKVSWRNKFIDLKPGIFPRLQLS